MKNDIIAKLWEIAQMYWCMNDDDSAEVITDAIKMIMEDC